mmetsp:Transcript_13018/g.15878  ORF Transcript_13018/g.15878 Transcript_13018/m.15878 type:complete len:87 (-) Transcript_13018:425-685(-)
MENEKAFLVRLGFVTSTSTECSGSWINDENKENDDPQKSTKTPGQKTSEWTALERNKHWPPPLGRPQKKSNRKIQPSVTKKRNDKK